MKISCNKLFESNIVYKIFAVLYLSLSHDFFSISANYNTGADQEAQVPELINTVKNVTLHEGRFSTQLIFYFNNPLFCKKKVMEEKQAIKLGFPGMQLTNFKEKETMRSLERLKKNGLIKEFSLVNRAGSLPQVNLLLNFPEEKEESVVVKWTQLESPTRLVIDIFKYKQLEALKKQSNILLYASHNETPHLPRTKRAKDIRIILDPGHGGTDPGCVNYGIKEKEVTLAIAEKIRQQLKQEGFLCSLTRSSDQTLSLQERSALADQMQADIFVSVHANSAAHINHEVSGLETYYISNHARQKTTASGIMTLSELPPPHDIQDLLERSLNHSADLAHEIQQNTLLSLREKDYDCQNRGVKQNSALVLMRSMIPSALVEVGYTSHKKEARRLITEEYQETLAEGIAQGIKKYLSKHYVIKK